MNDNTTLSDSPSFESFDDDSTGYDPTTGTFHRQFDADSDTIIGVIVESVGAVTNCDPTTMTALYETIDPEALGTLMQSNRDRPIEVSFSYEGCRVSVSNHGTVVVEPPEQ